MTVIGIGCTPARGISHSDSISDIVTSNMRDLQFDAAVTFDTGDRCREG
ncbi:MAG: hypothetical protein ACLTCB_04075 [Merdibacter sp.]